MTWVFFGKKGCKNTLRLTFLFLAWASIIAFHACGPTPADLGSLDSSEPSEDQYQEQTEAPPTATPEVTKSESDSSTKDESGTTPTTE